MDSNPGGGGGGGHSSDVGLEGLAARRMAGAALQDQGGGGASQFPPLLNIEHQELIRAVERAQVAIAANRELCEMRMELLDVKIEALCVKLDERFHQQTKSLDETIAAQAQSVLIASEASEKAIQAALLSQEKAVGKAEMANEKRFESVNEFRAQLGDIIGTMIPRTEANARIGALEDKITDLKAVVDKGLGSKKGAQENLGMMFTVLGALIAIATLLILMYN